MPLSLTTWWKVMPRKIFFFLPNNVTILYQRTMELMPLQNNSWCKVQNKSVEYENDWAFSKVAKEKCWKVSMPTELRQMSETIMSETRKAETNVQEKEVQEKSSETTMCKQGWDKMFETMMFDSNNAKISKESEISKVFKTSLIAYVSQSTNVQDKDKDFWRWQTMKSCQICSNVLTKVIIKEETEAKHTKNIFFYSF